MGGTKRRVTVMLDPDILERLTGVKERVGLSVSEQLRRGARLWLESREWPERHSGQLERPGELSHRSEGRKARRDRPASPDAVW